MSLTMIIDSDAVIGRLSLKDIQEVRDAIDSALTSTHAVIQGLLCTVFEKTVRNDIIYLQDGRFPTSPRSLMCCRLSQGFVQSGTLVVTCADTRRTLKAGEDVTIIPATDYEVDLVRGYLMVEDEYVGQWVNIAYTAGFDNTHKAPEWLQEAVLAYIPHMLAQPSGTFDASAMNAATSAAKADFAVAAKIVEPYLRNKSYQFVPLT